MANSAGYHESEDKLRPETLDNHRALTSMQEELEAADCRFVDGTFLEMDQTPVDWAWFDAEYLLRVETNADEAGRHAPGTVTVTVLEEGVLRERFSVDYAAFPYQPATETVRLGVNTHGTDWTLRGLRVWYLG